MPNQTTHSALVKMYFDGDGAPRTFPQRQRLTRVSFGLFPADNDQLPEGRIKFCAARKNGPQDPGRDHWRNWVTEVIKDSGVHRIVTQALMENSLHPLTICLNSRSGSLDFWPDGRMYVPLAVDNVASELFLSDALDPLGWLQLELRDSTQAAIQGIWKHLGNQLKRSWKRIPKLEAKATEAFLSESHFLPLFTYIYTYRSFSVVKKEKLTKTILKDEELRELIRGLGAEVNVKITNLKTRKCM